MRRVIAWALLAVALVPTTGLGQTQSPAPIPTELWVSGDDGLTTRFADSVRRAIGSSTDLALAAAKQGQLVMTIPRNLYWHMAQGKLNFQYVVIFTDRDSRYRGVSIGACWENEMDGCAASVVSEGRAVWARE